MSIIQLRGGSGANSVIPGLYVYYNNKWNYIFLENLKIPNTRTLQADLTLGLGNSSQPENAITANYGDPIKIETDGAYSFALRLFIRPVNPNDIIAPQRLVVYVWLFQNDTVVDVAELNPIIFPPAGGNDIASYSVVLSAELQKNDNVTMRFSRHGGTPSIKLTANETKDNALVYWRLEQYNTN